MSNATSPRPLFPVPSTVPSRSPEENVALLGTVAHVVEVKAPYALVHASPVGVAKIASELGLEVFHSKKGGEYYAVKIAKVANVALVRPAPVPAPVVPRPAPRVEPGVTRLVLSGGDYIVRETNPKRRMDSRRWEVRKDGELVDEPYIVTFQDDAGHKAQCSCKGWIYHRVECKHIKGLKAAFGGRRQQELSATA